MKFGRRLQEEAYEPYAPYYIAYKELKKAIKLITGTDTSQVTISEVTSNFGTTGAFQGAAERPPGARFQDLLNHEVKRVNNFAILTYTTCINNINSLITELPKVSSLEELHELYKRAEKAAEAVSRLYSFVQLNLIGFRKITKKYDKHNNSTSCTWYMAQLLKEPFINLNFENLISSIGACFQQLSDKKYMFLPKHINETPSIPFPPVRRTYVVLEEDLMKACIYLAKYIPLVSMGRKQCSTVLKPYAPELCKVDGESGKLCIDSKDNSQMSSSLYKYERNRLGHGCVYFDNPNTFECYFKCIEIYHSRHPPKNSSCKCLRIRLPVRSMNLDQNEYNPSFINKTPQTSLQLSNDYYMSTQNNNILNNVVLEFVAPDCFASDPHEWFDAPFQNDMIDSPIESNAVVLSLYDIDMLLQNQFNIDHWITQQRKKIPDLTSKRIETMTELLKEAQHFINVKGYRPSWQHWCHRTVYQGRVMDDNLTDLIHANHINDGNLNINENSYALVQPNSTIYAYLDEDIHFACWDNQHSISFSQQAQELNILLNNATTSKPSFGIISIQYDFPFEFLSRLSGLTTVCEIWKYSYFLHGTSLFYREQIPRQSIPEWYKLIVEYHEDYFERKEKINENINLEKNSSRSSSIKQPPSQPQNAVRMDILPLGLPERVLHNHKTFKQNQKSKTEEKDQVQTINFALSREPPSLSPNPYYALETNRSPRNTYETQQEFTRRPQWCSLHSIRNAFSSIAIAVAHFFGRSDQHDADHKNKTQTTAAKIRVEPKTFFANERTLLQWMNTSVLISTISISLLNFGNSAARSAGFILAPIALFFLIYSFIIYVHRSRCLEQRKYINYNDKIGPSILVVSLTLALGFIIYLNMFYKQ